MHDLLLSLLSLSLLQVFTARLPFGPCTIRKVHKWRLTKRSRVILHKKIGFFFFLTCLFNTLFLVAFQFRAYVTSLIFMVFYYVFLLLLYLRSASFKKFKRPPNVNVQDELKKIETTNDAMAKKREEAHLAPTGRPRRRKPGTGNLSRADKVKLRDHLPACAPSGRCCLRTHVIQPARPSWLDQGSAYRRPCCMETGGLQGGC